MPRWTGRGWALLLVVAVGVALAAGSAVWLLWMRPARLVARYDVCATPVLSSTQGWRPEAVALVVDPGGCISSSQRPTESPRIERVGPREFRVDGDLVLKDMRSHKGPKLTDCGGGRVRQAFVGLEPGTYSVSGRAPLQFDLPLPGRKCSGPDPAEARSKAQESTTERARRAFEHCYLEAVRGGSNPPPGRATVRLTIERSGRVKSAIAEPRDNVAWALCATNAAQDLTFPPPTDGEATLQFVIGEQVP